MSRTHREAALIGATSLVTIVLLSGCTPAWYYGVRLNADETIDVVLCDTWPLDGEYFVDFDPDYGAGIGDTAEWLVTGRESLFGDRVVTYGVDIEGTTTERLAEPPADWESVDFVVGSADRSDLVEGEWVWHTDDFPWVPDQPCISEDELG